MSYPRACNKCRNNIFMIQINGKWCAFDDATATTYHKCFTEKTDSKRISELEKNLQKLYDLVKSHCEKLSKLELKNYENYNYEVKLVIVLFFYTSKLCCFVVFLVIW